MSKAAARKGKTSKKSSAKIGRISLSIRRPRSRGEDRLDGEAALKALRESAERIPYEKARRDLGL
jgi:thymidine phosphorylase